MRWNASAAPFAMGEERFGCAFRYGGGTLRLRFSLRTAQFPRSAGEKFHSLKSLFFSAEKTSVAAKSSEAFMRWGPLRT
jgi:hypothetical protein